MGNTMKAAVVRELGKPLRSRKCLFRNPMRIRFSFASPRPGSATPTFTPRRAIGRSNRNRLSSPATKVWASRRDRPCRSQRQGRRPGRHSLAAYGVWLLPALPDRMGDVVRLPVEQRLFGQWQLRRICARRSHLRRTIAGQSRMGSGGANPLCRRDRLQRTQGDRGEAG